MSFDASAADHLIVLLQWMVFKNRFAQVRKEHVKCNFSFLNLPHKQTLAGLLLLIEGLNVWEFRHKQVMPAVWAEHMLSWYYMKQDQVKAAFYCHVVLLSVIFNNINYFKKTSQQLYITSDWIKIFSIYLQLGYTKYNFVVGFYLEKC